MNPGRSQPSIVIDVRVLVTHADSVATMEREMGTPPRLIRAPDVCYLFHARSRAAVWLGGALAILWHRSADGPDPPNGWAVDPLQSSHTIIPPRAGRDTRTPETGLIRQTGPRMAPPATGETIMRSTTDPGHEGRDQTAPPPDRCTGVRWDHECPARDGGLL
jgi:hypothetical protein